MNISERRVDVMRICDMRASKHGKTGPKRKV